MSTTRSGSLCCVLGCPNNLKNSPGTKFYRFQAVSYKLEQRNKWINAIRRANPDGSSWQPTPWSRLCSRHFIGNEKSGHPLSPSYLPTIFSYIHRQNASAKYVIGRFKRAVSQAAARNCTETFVAKEQKTHRKTIIINTIEETSQGMDLEDLISTVKDEACQCNFIEEKSENCKIFICNRIQGSSFCEAETQAYISPSNLKNGVNKKKCTKDVSCGYNITFVDACIGVDFERNSCNIDLNGYINGISGFSTIKNDQDMLDLAGVDVNTFIILLDFFTAGVDNRTKLSKENKLLVFLFKIKLGLTFSAIGVLFNIHRTTVSRIFYSLLNELSQTCKQFIQWPPKETIQTLMPPEFRQINKNVRVIIDCTEIPVEQPNNISQRVHLYSHYKKGFRVKILVGCTPHGQISFLSEAYGGRATDSQITIASKFLQLLQPGDVVLADKGFPQIKTMIDDSGKGILVVMPPFLRNECFTASEVEETQTIASIKIHIERIMQRIKTFHIMSKFSINMLPYVNEIIFICCALVNLQPPIIKEKNLTDE
ncbi:uncharacterized protein [Prorops nasuta]|uniref:uncharacterized protein n=1 Tax=Prorops nasuta TaxID=863751 RepID=UPI0034CF1729